MAAQDDVTVSVPPAPQRPSSAQRRADAIATLANQQATLKQEAAERRANRAEEADAVPTEPPRRRRPHAR